MASTLSGYMFWARMFQVACTTVILGTNGFLIRLSQLPFPPQLSLQHNIYCGHCFVTVIPNSDTKYCYLK
jgi:hypothetical protein